MKKYKGYLIDLDGTMYRGTEGIKAAIDFVHKLKTNGIPYLYVTNNSSKTAKQVADHLNGFGIKATAEEVFTTAMATANYISKNLPNARVFMIGEEGLRQAMLEKSLLITDNQPNVVVVGIDREINYEKLAKACLAVREGATFISTNGDIALPTERGLMPGNGAITSVISVSTQIAPIFIGKPHSIIMEQALEQIGTLKKDTLMVGDNYDTDILAGIKSGIDTLLVHTGVTMEEHLKEKDILPTYALHSLEDWCI
ncbi:TIGR01457 family HAD-type hydrolase [Lederbergia lenta]|uniref:HAD-superfamily hydrolase n=1 Tax=Lederbergia lenta TaxID=1467 RepID=A0A2X4WAA5_LEDLE|nr:TIGR01457 family HAD-type hydrolase [Lederbergia lenta]MCM3112949.1 TIGR01457 family HAD-type hydrolase [Lederbergia lenta]MEC2326662.1 TIGR01457 family HAD-type hydrolase [Lederbergia lenta]SQI61607.1 HAD-superfamily hydrolase [Lederbergia lenta]